MNVSLDDFRAGKPLEYKDMNGVPVCARMDRDNILRTWEVSIRDSAGKELYRAMISPEGAYQQITRSAEKVVRNPVTLF